MSNAASGVRAVTNRLTALIVTLTMLTVVSGCSEGRGSKPDPSSTSNLSSPGRSKTASAPDRSETAGGSLGRSEAASAASVGSATVSASGFAVTDGTTLLTGLAGVAPVGTAVTMTLAPQPALPAAVGWVQAAPGFDVKLANGLQPSSPVTVTTDVDPARGVGKRLVFITSRSGSAAWQGVPVAVNGTRATTRLSHFSGGFFGWLDDVSKSFEKGVNDYLKLRFDPPACRGKVLTLAGKTYTASVNGNGVFVCVENDGGAPALTVHSNSPFVWRVAGKKGAVTPGRSISPVETSGVATLAAYNLLYSYMRDRETVLVPGGNTSLRLTGVGPWKVTADVDPGLGLIAAVVAGVDMYLTMSGARLVAREKAAIGECAAGVIDAGVKPDPGKVTRAVIDCFGTVVKGAAAAVVAIISSLASVLVTQFIGVAGELTRTNHLTITVGAKQEPARVTVAQMQRLGACGSDCKITGTTRIDHSRLGPLTVVTTSVTEGPGEVAVTVIDANGRVVFTRKTEMYAWELAKPATDRSGNVFIRYNPGRYDGIFILRPTPDGFDAASGDYGDGSSWNFYYARLIGPGRDGLFTIEQSDNDCAPDCASGTVTTEMYHWDGARYSRR